MTGDCPICGVTPVNELLHADWHAALDARLTLLEAHQENLIVRVFDLEERPDVTQFEVDQ